MEGQRRVMGGEARPTSPSLMATSLGRPFSMIFSTMSPRTIQNSSSPSSMW